jgi:methionyl-tRNA formyltransferase
MRMSSDNNFTCLVFTSADNQSVAKVAAEIINSSMKVKKIFTLNRNSPNINEIKNDGIFSEQIDFIFNYLSPKKFPEWLINFPKFNCYNFHPGSYKYPGVGSASFAIYNQDKEFGLTAHRMDTNFDSGDIVCEKYFSIDPSWRCDELFETALKESEKLLDDTVQMLIKNQVPPKINNWSGKAVTRQEFVKWMTYSARDDARDLSRLVNAVVHPKFPGPFLRIDQHLFSYLNTGSIE